MNLDRFVQARRAAGALGALACTLALSTACVGSSGSGTSPTATGAANATTTGSRGTSGAAAGGTGGTSGGAATSSAGGGSATGGSGGSGGSTGGSTGGAAAGPSTCLVRYLNLTTSGGQGTAGSVYVNLVFKNLDNHPCTLYGYPGVSFGQGGPGTGVTLTEVGAPADKNPAVAKQLITLPPQGYAYALLQINDAGDYSASSCDPVATTYLMVYPPNTTNQLYVPFKSTACGATGTVTMHVQAVQAGTGS